MSGSSHHLRIVILGEVAAPRSEAAAQSKDLAFSDPAAMRLATSASGIHHKPAVQSAQPSAWPPATHGSVNGAAASAPLFYARLRNSHSGKPFITNEAEIVAKLLVLNNLRKPPPTNSRIKWDFPPKSMIPKDRGGGGTG